MKKQAFTLLEVILVMTIMGLVASTMLLTVDDLEDRHRYEETLRRMKLIENGINGFQKSTDEFVDGYIANTGLIPETLTDLIVRKVHATKTYLPFTIPEWEYRENGLSFGWRGKYINFNDENEIYDDWGSPIIYNYEESTGLITLKSLGADRKADITDETDDGYEESNRSYNKDITLTFTADFSKNDYRRTYTLNLMEKISKAIQGYEKSNGAFIEGFVSDTGELPVTLADLITKPASIQNYTVVLDSTKSNYGLGFGWRSRYINFSDETEVKDGWGTQIVFSTNADGAFILKSLGADKEADKAAGHEDEPVSNDGYNKDFIYNEQNTGTEPGSFALDSFDIEKDFSIQLINTTTSAKTLTITLICPNDDSAVDPVHTDQVLTVNLASEEDRLEILNFTVINQAEPPAPNNKARYFRHCKIKIEDGGTTVRTENIFFHPDSALPYKLRDLELK